MRIWFQIVLGIAVGSLAFMGGYAAGENAPLRKVPVVLNYQAVEWLVSECEATKMEARRWDNFATSDSEISLSAHDLAGGYHRLAEFVCELAFSAR